jgi:hypothetical protein
MFNENELLTEVQMDFNGFKKDRCKNNYNSFKIKNLAFTECKSEFLSTVSIFLYSSENLKALNYIEKNIFDVIKFI